MHDSSAHRDERLREARDTLAKDLRMREVVAQLELRHQLHAEDQAQGLVAVRSPLLTEPPSAGQRDPRREWK